MNNYRYKIGISLIFDYRYSGSHESFERIAMGIAQRIARLYSEKLRYSEGTPVDCSIADTMIGRVTVAAACTKKFLIENVGNGQVTQTSILRVPAAIHNLPEKALFRPLDWGASGSDHNGSDFRTYKNYGPLYC